MSHLLSNEEILRMLLDSPIKDLVEEVHSNLFLQKMQSQSKEPTKKEQSKYRQPYSQDKSAAAPTSAGHTKSNSHFIDPL